MYNHILYLLYWLVNSVVIYISSILFWDAMVLGNAKYTSVEAAAYSGFWLTFFIWIAWDFFMTRGTKIGKDIRSIILFWGVNIIGLWFISLMYGWLGMEISGALLLLGLGLFLNLVQRSVWGMLTEPRKS